jgi:hypothetical protein
MVIRVEAFESVLRVRALASEVAILRRALASMSNPGQDMASREEIVRLLSEVVLFRLALDEDAVLSSLKKQIEVDHDR